MNDKIKTFIKDNYVFIIISLFYLLFRIISLDTDWGVLEPDEADYQYVANQFIYSSHWPVLRNNLYLEQFPLFVFLSAKLKLIFNLSNFISGRLLSILGTYLVGLALYLWSKNKTSYINKYSSTIIYFLIPLVFFYSRTGTLDQLFIGLGFLSLVIFINAKTKILYICSGILLALGILTKTAGLIFVIPIVLLLLLKLQDFYTIVRYYLLSLLISLFIPLSIYYVNFGSNILSQTMAIPSGHLLPIFNIKVHLAVLLIYLQKISWFISPPVLLLFLTGIILIINHIVLNKKLYLQIILDIKYNIKNLIENKKLKQKQYDQYSLFILEIIIFLIPGLIFISLFDFWPRYILLIMPGLAIISAIAVDKLSFRFKYLNLLIYLLIMQFTYQTFLSTLHVPMRHIQTKLLEIIPNNKLIPIYSSFDPEKVGYYMNKQIKLLSLESLDYSIVITDQLKTDIFADFVSPQYKEMRTALNLLPKEKLIYTYTDPYPNFPGNKSSNTFYVYLISGTKVKR